MIRQRLGSILQEMFNPPVPRSIGQALDYCNRFVAWLWNTIKAAPGVHQVGHGIATVLGLYRLDRWLAERDRRKLRELVPLLESAGMHDTARKILAETEKPQDA